MKIINKILSTSSWTVMIILAILVGLLPLTYFIPGIEKGFLESKGILVEDFIWNTALNLHIIGGGIALLIGWFTLLKFAREKYIKAHRTIGLIYWISVLVISAPSGFYLAFFANGGILNKFGFGFLAIFWFLATLKGIMSIKNKKMNSHQRWMIRSYALTFAAVTLRLYMPLFILVFGFTEEFSYSLVAWTCWIPNLIIAELIIRTKGNKKTLLIKI